MQHRDFVILSKVLDELQIAVRMMANADFESFNRDEMLKRAVCMTVINIGELVKNLSDDMRTEYKHIPWKSIAGFRDIAAHKYQTLRMQDVYLTVTKDFPALQEEIKKIME